MSKTDNIQEVSSYIALALIMIVALFVTWFLIGKAQDIISNAKESETFNVNLEKMEHDGKSIRYGKEQGKN